MKVGKIYYLIQNRCLNNRLIERKNKLSNQLTELDNQPKIQAERKGQISENLRISDKDKINNDIVIEETDQTIESLRSKLNEKQKQ